MMQICPQIVFMHVFTQFDQLSASFCLSLYQVELLTICTDMLMI